MKKALLTVCVFGSFQGIAQLAPPSIPEDELHPGGTWDIMTHRVTNLNTHSRGNLLINMTNSDLYVITWDYANDPNHAPECGIAIRQYAAGTPVQSTTAPLFEEVLTQSNGDFTPSTDRASLEAGILREGGNTYIALSYYQITWSGGMAVERDIYLDLYEWNGVGGLTIVSSQNLSQQGDLPYGWVHMDVNNLTDLVVTWEQEDQIFTVGGTMSGGLQLSGTGILEEGTINGHILGRPDVAMMRDDNGDVNLYYVMTRGDVLFATKGRFDDLMGIPLGSVDPLPVELLHSKGVAGGELIFDIPRIDAPDNALYAGHEAWSFVVTENYADADYVYTASYSDQIGGIAESYLNDGIVVPCANCNISPNPTMDPDIYNLRATVAYSDNGSDRFYAWCFRNPTWAFLPPGAEATYINIKTDENLNLLHTAIATDWYCRVPNAQANTNYSPAIGLSTQNDASPQLFTAYVQWPDPITPFYYFGLKTTDWFSTTGFRPEDPTHIVDVNEAKALQVSPNPFTAGFTMDIKGGNRDAVYSLRIYNVVGQEVYRDKGTATSLNRLFGSVGEQWPSGAYYIELSGEHTLFRQKLIKY